MKLQMTTIVDTILKWSFYLQIILGVFDIVLFDKTAEYNLPYNAGWIMILGFLTIISKLEEDNVS